MVAEHLDAMSVSIYFHEGERNLDEFVTWFDLIGKGLSKCYDPFRFDVWVKHRSGVLDCSSPFIDTALDGMIGI